MDLPEPSKPSTAIKRPGKPILANVFISGLMQTYRRRREKRQISEGKEAAAQAPLVSRRRGAVGGSGGSIGFASGIGGSISTFFTSSRHSAFPNSP